MTIHWMKKTLIATACCITLLSAHAATGTEWIGQAQAYSVTKADNVVAASKALRGKVTYRYGTNKPGSLIFDCSSFTKYVYGKYGVNLKWGTSAQVKQGQYVAKSSLRKGDLIFFNNGRTSAVSHVGIYIGNGQFIHNTIGGGRNGVYMDKLSNYSHRYATARRVL